MQRRQEALSDVEGLRYLALFPTYRSFVDLCGRLRFQVRWGQLYRVPRTSVLGHMLIVAILSYLFSLEIDACPKRGTNNYFTGLFHDLPEVLTKDIISPVKTAATQNPFLFHVLISVLVVIGRYSHGFHRPARPAKPTPRNPQSSALDFVLYRAPQWVRTRRC